MLGEFVQRIAELAIASIPKVERIGDRDYVLTDSETFREIVPEVRTKPTLETYSLQMLVSAVKAELDAYSDDYIHSLPLHVFVTGYGQVKCCETIYKTVEYARDIPYSCHMLNVPGFSDCWMDHDQAMIALRTKFQENDGSIYLIDLLSRIMTEGSVTSEDNGISQQVTVQKGVSLVGRENVRPIVKLKPYRTFWELDQPESEFLVRVGEGGKIGLFEADGGAWKYKARIAIRDYLREAFAAEIEKGLVVVSA